MSSTKNFKSGKVKYESIKKHYKFFTSVSLEDQNLKRQRSNLNSDENGTHDPGGDADHTAKQWEKHTVDSSHLRKYQKKTSVAHLIVYTKGMLVSRARPLKDEPLNVNNKKSGRKTGTFL